MRPLLVVRGRLLLFGVQDGLLLRVLLLLVVAVLFCVDLLLVTQWREDAVIILEHVIVKLVLRRQTNIVKCQLL